MLYSLTGELVAATPAMAAVSCSGVAFKCFISEFTCGQLPSVGEKVTLYTYLSVREDALDLYGFIDEAELECFKLLTSVSGVGPKVALAILSEMDSESLVLCVASGDSRSLTRANGVGGKTAQRIVLELKDKMGAVPVSAAGKDRARKAATVTASTNVSDAVAVLVSLGYSQHEASAAVGGLDRSLTTEELIKQAISALSFGG